MINIAEAAKIRVLERAFDIIECFTAKDPELTLVEIAKKTNLSLATVHRSIQTMLARGYIEQDINNGKYHLGMQFVKLSGIVVSRFDVIRVATPYLQTLSKSTEQNVNLSIYDSGKALCLVDIESFQNFLMGIKVGQSLPIYAGALSKVILAHLPPSEIESILSNELSAFTPKTIAKKEALLQELDEIKRVGCATSQGELAIGAAAIAAPIFNYNENLVAGISISGPEQFYTDETKEYFTSELISTANAISKELGFVKKPFQQKMR